MKKLILSLAVAFCGYAQAEVGPSAVTDPAVKGRWQSMSPIFSNNGMNIYLGMEFADTTAVMSSICTFPGGKTLEAKVSVQVNAGEGKIQTVTGGKNEVRDGSYTCNAEVQPGVVQYTIVGPVLRLNAQGMTLDFSRR